MRVCFIINNKGFLCGDFYLPVYILRLHFSSVVPPMLDTDLVCSHKTMTKHLRVITLN